MRRSLCCAQYVPLHIIPQVFATHRAASCLLDCRAVLSGGMLPRAIQLLIVCGLPSMAFGQSGLLTPNAGDCFQSGFHVANHTHGGGSCLCPSAESPVDEFLNDFFRISQSPLSMLTFSPRVYTTSIVQQ